MKQQRNSLLSQKVAGVALALFGLGGLLGGPGEAQAQTATQAIIDGVIDRVTVDDITNHWSGGSIEVNGQRIIIPKNLLMDLPANRMTLQEFMSAAPGLCPALGQSGLGRADSPFCNTSGQPGYALIHANHTSNGNVIAGDVFIQKGVEAVFGTVTYIDYNNGYFRMNGNLNDPLTGVMVRINDPDSRHTLQFGPGCVAGQSNCSADPRFTLDGDNYTNVFVTGFPLCIPSTTARQFVDVLDLNGNGNVAETLSSAAAANGTGDQLCPTTNRTINLGKPVDDSRRFAPIMLGDSISAEGNFERINGVRFLSAHSTMVAAGLTTKNLPDQPDYLFLDEVFIDMPGFQNQRVRSLNIGFATLAPEDVLFWTIHYDPSTNQKHELAWSSILGCDLAAGPATCGGQGIAGLTQIFRVRHDIDFLVGAKPRLNPCAHLIADPRIHKNGIIPCNNNAADTNTAGMFGVMSPIPHEIQARTGHEMNDLYVGGVDGAAPGPRVLKTLDINGNAATHGQYLFPFGMGLGGIDIPNFFEINLDGVASPIMFSGIPWNLDRRLSPGGCLRDANDVAQCEQTPQPLDPFPFEIIDPRLQASIPLGAFTDPTYTQVPLPRVADRILSYVDATGRANGPATLLAWPPVNPTALPITPVVDVPATNLPPTITSAPVVTARAGVPYAYQVVATDDAPGLIYTLGGSPPAGMAISATGLITWTPTQAQAPTQGVAVTVTDAGGLYDKQVFVISVNGAPAFVNVPAPSAAKVGVLYAYQPFATDPNLPNDTLTFSLIAGPTGSIPPAGVMSINPTTGRVTWTPIVGQVGARTFSIRVTDLAGASATRTFNVTVAP